MKLELLENHQAEDIKQIWTTYMQEKGRLADLLTVGYFLFQFLSKPTKYIVRVVELFIG
jgi:hypothetical protein